MASAISKTTANVSRYYVVDSFGEQNAPVFGVEPNNSGAPGEARTPGLMIRSHSLYPTELRAHTLRRTTPLYELREWHNQSSG